MGESSLFSASQSLNVAPQIDTSNITKAFVSGMKEALNLYQNQYNYIVVSWTVGYIIGQWVQTSLISRKVVLKLIKV